MLHLLIKLAAIQKNWVNSHTMVAFFWKFSIFYKKKCKLEKIAKILENFAKLSKLQMFFKKSWLQVVFFFG